MPWESPAGGTTSSDSHADSDADDGTDGPGPGGPKVVEVTGVEPAPRPLPRSLVVRIQEGKSCPAPPTDWSLDEPPTTGLAALDARMDRYCQYTFTGTGVPPAMPSLDDPAGVIEVAMADYAQVLPQMSAAERMYGLFRERVGAQFTDPSTNVPMSDRPTIAIIDTADADLATTLDREEHGQIMAGIINTIRCPEPTGACADDQLLLENAFPVTLSTSATPNDEVRGTVWSLNQALLRAIGRWNAQVEAGDERPLVLNMSVGWEWTAANKELLFGGRTDILDGVDNPIPGVTPAVESLYLTLAWASCREDVLAVAATGNTRGGACEQTGTMAPAAWEQLPTLTAIQCDQLMGTKADGHSMTYGAGGIDAGQRSIGNARPLSEPPRVLYASMAAMPQDAGFFAPLTGTSVSTAALSAIAAQYWATAPSQSAADVIASLDATGKLQSVDLPEIGASNVPRILAHAVVPNNIYTPPTPQLYPTPPSQAPAPTSPIVMAADDDRSKTCSGRTINAHKCPGATAASAGPQWPELSPQPITPMCPICPLATNQAAGTAVLDVDVELRGRTLSDQGRTAVLEVHGAGGQISTFSLDLTHCPDADSSPSGFLLDETQRCTVDLANYMLSGGSVADEILQMGASNARLFFHVQTDPNQSELTGNEIDIHATP